MLGRLLAREVGWEDWIIFLMVFKCLMETDSFFGGSGAARRRLAPEKKIMRPPLNDLPLKKKKTNQTY